MDLFQLLTLVLFGLFGYCFILGAYNLSIAILHHMDETKKLMASLVPVSIFFASFFTDEGNKYRKKGFEYFLFSFAVGALLLIVNK